MVALTENNLEGIQVLCKKHYVKSFYLVGSATKEDRLTKQSDVDFLYQFDQKAMPEMEYADHFFDLMYCSRL